MQLNRILLPALMLATVALPAAAEFEPVNCTGLGISCETTADAETFVEVILDIINFVLILVGVLALAALIWGGIMYIISLGDDKRIETAKKIIIYAIVGLIVVGLSGLIVNFTINLFTF